MIRSQYQRLIYASSVRRVDAWLHTHHEALQPALFCELMDLQLDTQAIIVGESLVA